VITCSGLHDINLDRVWAHVERHRAWLDEHGGLAAKRRDQLVQWTRSLVRDRLLARLDAPKVRAAVEAAEAAVREERLTPDQAATQILATLDGGGA
jgi:LAO/AO transport system kinase